MIYEICTSVIHEFGFWAGGLVGGNNGIPVYPWSDSIWLQPSGFLNTGQMVLDSQKIGHMTNFFLLLYAATVTAQITILEAWSLLKSKQNFPGSFFVLVPQIEADLNICQYPSINYLGLLHCCDVHLEANDVLQEKKG